MNLTQDPLIIIVYHKKDIVVYFDISSSKSWVIWGKCSYCGECIDGAINPDLRAYNERKDIPTRPEIEDLNCSLIGCYL